MRPLIIGDVNAVAAPCRWEKTQETKWEEEQAARRPSPAGVEGGGEGGSGGVTGAAASHHVAAGRAPVGGAVLAAGRGEGISQAWGAGGAQQGGRPGFVGLSGKKLVPNEHDWRLPLC